MNLSWTYCEPIVNSSRTCHELVTNKLHRLANSTSWAMVVWHSSTPTPTSQMNPWRWFVHCTIPVNSQALYDLEYPNSDAPNSCIYISPICENTSELRQVNVTGREEWWWMTFIFGLDFHLCELNGGEILNISVSMNILPIWRGGRHVPHSFVIHVGRPQN